MNLWQMICYGIAIISFLMFILFKCNVPFMKHFFLQYSKLSDQQKSQLDEGAIYNYFAKQAISWFLIMIVGGLLSGYGWYYAIAFLLALIFVVVKDLQQDVETMYSRFRHHDFR